QANDATLTHAQAASPLTDDQQEAIVQFELALATAQESSKDAGRLDVGGVRGGPLFLVHQPFYVTINDVLGADASGAPFDPDAMRLFRRGRKAVRPEQASIARGAALFGTKPIAITGVGGLNDDLGLPTIRGTCTTCHDTPGVGNHSVALPIDIGLTDASR